MQNNNILSGEGISQLNQALDKILASYLDILKFTEDLIPEDLVKNGLRHCILQLCKELEAKNQITIHVTDKWEIVPLQKNAEQILYKICNALITFVLSQKEVTQPSITVEQTKESFSFSIQFTCNNFTLSGISSSEIKKIAHIKSLIETLNGSFIIYQKQENLTDIIVEVKN